MFELFLSFFLFLSLLWWFIARIEITLKIKQIPYLKTNNWLQLVGADCLYQDACLVLASSLLSLLKSSVRHTAQTRGGDRKF